MPVQMTFVTAQLGQWTQVCEYRETRQSLIIQAFVADVTVAFNTSGPLVTLLDGAVVGAGLIDSPSLSVSNGPACLRLSRPFDGDLVAQSWYVFIPGTAAPPLTRVVGTNLATASYTINIPAGVPGLFVLWEAAVFSGGGGYSVVTNTSGDPISSFAATTVADGTGFSAFPTLWYWTTSGVADVVTVTLFAMGDAFFGYAIANTVASPLSVDQGPAIGSSWDTFTSVPTATINDLIVSGAVYFGLNHGGNVSEAFINGIVATPFDTQFISTGPLPTDTIFYLSFAAAPYGIVGTQDVNWTIAFAVPSDGGTTVVADWPSGTSGGATVVVAEAFDIIEPPSSKRFTVPLPKLSPAGILALDDLLKRVK